MRLIQVLHDALCAVRSHRATAMVEYALLAALIAIVVMTAMTTLGTSVRAKFSTVATTI